ncbi:Zinc finger CCHC-type superfamily [Arabidopsis suecica]|uniref:Zinc finger CCHC-type superfamily n=1 Tax=Arabidopsis suecica TaxID=45249 RepID=A0A8T1ZFE8_ARASU|nr:Zinc finger CCHC-type superfamily [Arabidopsis suecica]
MTPKVVGSSSRDQNYLSKPVARVQGFFFYHGKEKYDAWIAWIVVFNSTQHKGSFTIMGENPFMEPTRDLPIVGGTGDFLMTRGYATLTNDHFDGTGVCAMGKRKSASKLRVSTPDPPEIDFQMSNEKVRNVSPLRVASGSVNRPDDRRSRSLPFEVSDSPDNIHSPYHLHSSDHPGLVLVPDLLDGSNYGTWIVAITTSIEAKNKIGFVDGSIVQPDDDDPYCKIWKRCNSMVKSWLMNSVSKKIYSSILYIPTAAEIWKDLHTRFHKSNLPRLYKLRQQIHSLRQGSMDLSSYHTATQSLWEELASLQVTARTVEDLLAERETNKVIDFLMGLNDGYDTVGSQILMKKSLPSLSEVYNLLDQEDSQKSARLSSATGMESTAFQVSQQSSLGGSNQYQRKDRPICTFCGKSGHIMDKCYKKHGYPVGFPKPKSFRPAQNIAANVTVGQSTELSPLEQNDQSFGDNLSTEQMQQIVSFLSTKLHSSSSVSKPEVHSVSLSSLPVPSSTNGPTPGTFFPSIICSFTSVDRPYVCSIDSNINAINAWVIDTGATNHICHDKSAFSTFHFLQNTTVTLPNGGLVSIVGIGSIHMGRYLELHDVLYIPQFKFNLLSVSCLTKSMGCKVWFDEHSCVLQDPSRELMIGVGRQVANLYFLDIESLDLPIESSSLVAATITSHDLWHKRLGHPSFYKLESLSHVLDFKKEPKIQKDFHCKTCHIAKQKHTPFISHNNISKIPFELVHIDTWGPLAVPTHDGFRYFLTIVDDHSRATWVYLMKNKSDVLTIFPSFVNMVETQFETKIKGVRSDNAQEFNFTQFYQSKGILPYHSCPETPQQNSVVERKHQHILNVARSLFFQSHLPLSYWGDCILAAVHLINRLPTPVLEDKSPFEVLTKKVPDYNELKVLGCLCYASTSPKNRHKFDPRARACVFLGYPSGYKGYKLLDLETNDIFISRHVIFHEELFPFAKSDLSQEAKSLFPDLIQHSPMETHSSSDDASPSSPSVEIIPSDNPAIDVPEPSVQTSHRRPKKPAYLQDYYCHSVGSSTIHEISKFLSYDKVSVLYFSFLACIDKNKEPSTYNEAKEFLVWCGAMDDEIGALEGTETWDICTLPPNKISIGCKWIYKIKYNADGSIERYKARLVAKGYTQQEGVDYTDTFSPVAKQTSVKLILAIAAVYNLSLTQLDISNAFLNGDLDEEIYMKLPPGYSTRKGDSLPPNAVCKLKKSLYGLKQASRQWFLKFSTTLIALGFASSYSDHTVFLKITDVLFMVVLVYVDDIIIASNNDAEVTVLKEQLHSHFKLRDLGPLKYFLGLEIARTSDGIYIGQRKYALDLLDDTGLLGCKPSSIPMDPSVKLSKDSGGDFVDAKSYRRLIGRLIQSHLKAVYKVLHYIKGTIGQGLFYSAKSEMQIQLFADADHSSCLDTRRSTSGYCLFLGSSLISWKSKKQQITAKSSAEAEYRSLSFSTDELVWLTHFLQELRIPLVKPSLVFCDSTAAIHIANNQVFHERTKHMERDCHSVRERLVAGLFKLLHISTNLQLADPFTKPLYPAVFKQLISKMGLLNIFIPS